MMLFINNNKNEKPKESLHMLILIYIFLIPTKFHPSTCSNNSLLQYHVSKRQFNANRIRINEFALTKMYSSSELDNANYSIHIRCKSNSN
jgi:peroxiredoxin